MKHHKYEWKEKQERLERIIKKKFFFKLNEPFEHNAEETGGIVPNNKYYLEDVEAGSGETENEELEEIRKVVEEHGDQHLASKYIVLIITEYIKKENVLENYIIAYKTLYDNIEQYYQCIMKKDDIDFIVENYLLKQKKPSENIYRSSNTRMNINKNEHTEKKERHRKHDKPERMDNARMDEINIEMETYTVSVVLKLKKKIIEALPMLKDIIANLKAYNGKNFYINSRTGIIENLKQQIYEYICEKRNTGTTKETPFYNEIEKDIVYQPYYNTKENRYDGECINTTAGSAGYSNTQYQDRNLDTSHFFNRLNFQGVMTNSNYLVQQGNKWHTPKTVNANIQAGSYEEIHSSKYEGNETDRKVNSNISKLINSKMSEDFHYASSVLQNNNHIPNISHNHIYEIKITTDKYLINLKTILILIEFVVLLHLYFKRCELEKKLNKKIKWKELYKYNDIIKHHKINYAFFYNLISKGCDQKDEQGVGDKIRNTDEEPILSSTERISAAPESVNKNVANEYLRKNKKNNSGESLIEQQKEKHTWDEKQMQKMYDYIKYLFDNIINECDFFFNIKFLYTLNICECSFLFHTFKKLLLQKNSEDDVLIMLTYCAYRTNNKELVSYCFWRLISVFENDILPAGWVRRDAPPNAINNYNTYQLLNSYNIVNAYPFAKSKEPFFSTNATTLKNVYSNCHFYEALNIIKDDQTKNFCEIDIHQGNMYCQKNLIDKSMFGDLVKNVRKDFDLHNKIPNGYIINEVQRVRNFSEFYSCCYILRNNKKEKLLMGFKKKGENKVYIYKYDKTIKQKYKESQTFFHMSGFLGVLICSFTGMKIKIFDNGISENYSNFFPNFKRENIITIEFDSNIISELPRHFVCNLYKEDKLIHFVYENKCPIWNEEKEMYELPFYGRVKLASAKNLQLILKKCILNDSLKPTFYGKKINDMVEYIIDKNNQKVAQAEISLKEDNSIKQSFEDMNSTLTTSSTKPLYTRGCVSEHKPHILKNVNKSLSFDNLKNKMNHKNGTFEIVNKDEEDIYLIFGKNSKDLFTLDFRHPLTTFEAFAIAISSLLKKKAVS